MKKSYYLGSLMALSSLISAPGVVVAGNPTSYGVSIYCPHSQPGQNAVTNFGSYLAGYGVEYILNQSNQVYFASAEWSMPGVPVSLANYYNDSVSYDSTKAVVSCNFKSSAENEPPFSISYYLTNGFGGYVDSQSNNAITIILPAGLVG